MGKNESTWSGLKANPCLLVPAQLECGLALSWCQCDLLMNVVVHTLSVDDMFLSIPLIHTYSRPLSFPTTLEDLRTLAEQLHSLKQEHFYGVLGLFSLAYLYKQTFAIPGSLFLVSCHGYSCHGYTWTQTLNLSLPHKPHPSLKEKERSTVVVPTAECYIDQCWDLCSSGMVTK